MKLLVDQNLPPKLVPRLEGRFASALGARSCRIIELR